MSSIKFPSKFIPYEHSVIRNMLIIMKNIPKAGAKALTIYNLLPTKIELEDYIDALVCLYAIKAIKVNNSQIINVNHHAE